MVKWQPIDGNSLQLDGGALFGNCPKAIWSKWHTPDEKNRIPMMTRSLLIKVDDGRNILVEAGIGAYMDPKMKERYGVTQENNQLLVNLEKAGLKEGDIDGVILTHLHFDHAGGMLANFGEKQRLLFPNAKIYVGKKHWNRAINPHIRERISFIPELHDLLKDSSRLVLIEDREHADLDFGLTFHFSEGHTVGMLIPVLETDTGPLAFVSDLVPGVSWVHLPITMGYDRYPERIVDEKLKLYDELVPKKGALFFTHDPTVFSAAILLKDSGYSVA